MIISATKVPFIVVFISIFTPWLTVLLGLKVVTLIPVLIACFFTFIYQLRVKKFLIDQALFLFSLLVFFHLIFSIASGRGIGSGGTLIFYFLSIIFYSFLRKIQPRDLIRYISIIYMIHLFFIIIELCIALLGYQSILHSMGQSDAGTPYKNYNHSYFLDYLGFSYVWGLNSMILGSQSASMLAVIAAIWFAPIFEGGISRYSKYLFILALVLIPITATMTGSIVFLILLLYVLFFIPGSILSRTRYRLIFLVTLPFTYSIIYSLVFFKLADYGINTAEFEIMAYLPAFLNPVFDFLNYNTLDKIFGVGVHIDKYEIVRDYRGSDFGLLTLLSRVGIYLVGLTAIFISYLCYKVRYLDIHRPLECSTEEDIWFKIAYGNLLATIGWLLSIIHYTSVLEVGGREILAFHIAACLISISKIQANRNLLLAR